MFGSRVGVNGRAPCGRPPRRTRGASVRRRGGGGGGRPPGGARRGGASRRRRDLRGARRLRGCLSVSNEHELPHTEEVGRGEVFFRTSPCENVVTVILYARMFKM